VEARDNAPKDETSDVAVVLLIFAAEAPDVLTA
jgi:hypothetical protein